MGNECSVAPLGCSTSPKTPLLPYEVAPTSRTFADGNHTFPKKSPSKKDISTMINGVFWKMNAHWHPCDVPRVQQPHSCLTKLHPLQEHSPTGITLNRHFYHDTRCFLENECSTSPTTPLLPCEVAPNLQNIRQRELHFPKKNNPQ